LTLTEWLVIAAVAGMLGALFLPDSATTARWEIERRARTWRPTSADRKQPDPSIMATDIDILGEWEVDRHRSGSSLTVTRASSPTFAVHFSTWGCVGQCEFDRTGRLRNGILKLDQPVAEYSRGAYDTLYSVRVNGEELLLPAAFVSEFQNRLAADHTNVSHDPVPSPCVFRRASSFRRQ